jgi:hypothetical protein
MWHRPGEPQYIENAVFQCLVYIGNFALFYTNRLRFYRGNIWFLVCLGFVWTGAMYGLALLVSVLVYTVPIPDPYALMGQSVLCWIFAMIAYRSHIDILHSIESPHNAGVPVSKSTEVAAPLQSVSDVSSGSSMSIVTVVPLSRGSGEGEMKPAIAWEGPCSPLAASGPSLASSTLMQSALSETTHSGAPSAFRVLVTNGPPAISGSDEIASASGSDSPDDAGFIASLEFDTPGHLDNESAIALPEIVRLHKMLVSVIAFFFFTGATWASETLVHLAFPSLAICGQLDLVRASWVEIAQSIFDFLSA